jgi:hypothetical protein
MSNLAITWQWGLLGAAISDWDAAASRACGLFLRRLFISPLGRADRDRGDVDPRVLAQAISLDRSATIGGMTLRVDGISLVLATIALTFGTGGAVFNRYVAHKKTKASIMPCWCADGVMIGPCGWIVQPVGVVQHGVSSYLLVAFIAINRRRWKRAWHLAERGRIGAGTAGLALVLA